MTPLFPLEQRVEVKPDKGLCDCCIPGIWVWLPVPKRGVNPTFWKLNFDVSGAALFALDWSIGVSFKNISFNAALLYVALPFVSPALDAVAKPSI